MTNAAVPNASASAVDQSLLTGESIPVEKQPGDEVAGATVNAGCKTVSGVMEKTRAGKGCGTCKPLVQRIVEWAAGGEVEELYFAAYPLRREPSTF